MKGVTLDRLLVFGMRGLIIKDPWIDLILSGYKKWEIRGSNTRIRGQIALIRSGSGLVVGQCLLTDTIGPLTLKEMKRNIEKHRVPLKELKSRLPYKKTFAWVLQNAKSFSQPIPYKHPIGAVIWVNLDHLAVRIKESLRASAMGKK